MPGRHLERPGSDEYNPAFHDEITSVPEAADFGALLREQIHETEHLVGQFGEPHAGIRYAPGKWTVRETIGHLSDCERVLSYRALRIARGDMTVLPAFDETAYVPAGEFETRSLASVMAEFRAVRAATIALAESLSDESARRRGNVGKGTMTVRALLYLIAGHERHHCALLRSRYLPARQTGDRALAAT